MMRCATLMPSPMMFICALRSFTRRTGPRLTPRRTGASPAMSRTDIAENSASSGSPMKVTAAPSPVSRMMRSRCGTGASASVSTRLKVCLSCSCSATGFFEYSTISRNRTLHTSVRLELSINCLRRNAARWPRSDLFYAHAGFRSGVRRNEENARSFAGGGEDHALGDAELHLARCKIGHHHRQPALEPVGRVGRLDAGEHGALAIAQVERQLDQLVGAVDRLGARDARHAQLQPVEVVDGNGVVHGLLVLRSEEQRVELRFLDARDEMLERLDLLRP